jgi:LysM domain
MASMTQRLGWSATAGIAVVVLAGACIPTGVRGPTRSPTSSEAIASTAVLSPSPSPVGPSTRPSFLYPTPTPLPTFFIYGVRPGDTLTSIAREHGTTGRSIAFWNRSRYPSLDPDSPTYAPNRIEVGWELLLIPDVELDPEELPQPSPTVASPAALSSPAA